MPARIAILGSVVGCFLVAPVCGAVPPARVNWALGAPATQSSTRAHFVASRAVDGVRDVDRRWQGASLTRSEEHPFWEVDLGEVRSIEEIRIHLCLAGCGAPLRDLAVFVSSEPFRHREAEATLLQLGVKFALVWGPLGDARDDGEREPYQTVRLAARGRWVRLQPIWGGQLGLAEVEVLGPPASAASTAKGLADPSPNVEGAPPGQNAGRRSDF